MMTSSASKKILLVDDELSLVSILTRVLQGAGYETRAASNGLEGLKLFLNEPWDLVIVDRSMPEMGGEELAVQIRAREPQLPIILISGAPRLVKRPDLFDSIYGKPFSSAAFLAEISRLLALRGMGPAKVMAQAS